MKTLLASVLALSLATSPAFASAKGKKILSCSAIDGSYVELSIYRNTGGTYRASVTEESFGGSYPTFHYDVQRLRDRAGLEVFRGKAFSLRINEERQGKLLLDGVANDLDCR